MPRAEYRTDRRIDAYIKSLPAWQAAKDHVNIFIYDPIAPDPEGIINQGQGNSSARAIQVRAGEAVNKKALVNLLKAVIANNRAGGWQRVQGRHWPSRGRVI